MMGDEIYNTFTYFNEETKKTETHFSRNWSLRLAFDEIHAKLHKQKWFVDQIHERKYMWASSPSKKNKFVWIKLPEGIDAREWHGLNG